MKPQDIFNLAIRLLGLFFIYSTVQAIPLLFSGPPLQLIVHSLLSAGFYFIIAWWLLGGAPLLAHRAYPTNTTDTDTGPAAKI